MTKLQNEYSTKRAKKADERNRRIIKHIGQAIVFLLTLVSGLASFITFGLTWPAILVAVVVFTLFLSFFFNILLLYDSRNRRKGPRQIVFLTPSSGGQPFYAAMLISLIKSASSAIGQNYILVPSMPTESFEALSIWSHFSSLEDRQLEIDGIIFIPDQPDLHFDELVGFHEERGDVPIVLVDVYFDPARYDERTRARLPSFVGGDEMAGGELAAKIVIDSVRIGTGGMPVVLIINGGVAPWEQQRTKAFRDELRAHWPCVKLIESPPINYVRSVAYETAARILRSLADSTWTISLDAVFACNDDMAIGVRGAIGRLLRDGYSFSRPPQIVGYDGIPEIREYLHEGDPFMAGTVDVLIEEQARTAMLLMHRLLRSGERRSEVRLITPRMVRREWR